MYQRFIGALSQADRDDYLLKASTIAPLLGAGSEPLFENEAALKAYLRQIKRSGDLIATDNARRLSAELLEGLPVPIVGPIANWLGRLLVREFLPEWARKQYGFTSTWFGRSTLRPLLPSRWVLWDRSYGQSVHLLSNRKKLQPATDILHLGTDRHGPHVALHHF